MDHLSLVVPAYPRKDAQDVENQRLLSEVRDLMEAALDISENVVTYTGSRLGQLREKGPELINAVHKLETHYLHEGPCGWDEDSVMKACKQEVTKEELLEVSNRPALNVPGTVDSLKALSGAEPLSRGRLLMVKESLRDINCHSGPEATSDLYAATTAMYDVKHVDPVAQLRSEMDEFHEETAKHRQLVAEAQQAFDDAVSGGDVVKVERAHRRLIAVRYEYLVHCTKVLRHLRMVEEAEEGLSYLEDLRVARENVKAAAKEFKDEKDRRYKVLEEDIVRCEETMRREHAANDEGIAAHTEAARKYDDELKNVVERKGQVIEELRAKAAELRDLMQHQHDLVAQQIEAKQAEEKRITAYNEFADLAAQHKQRVEQCLKYYKACPPLTHALECFRDDMCSFEPKNCDEEIGGIQTKEVGTFMEAYRAFVFTCGDLTVRKVHRLDNLERQTRLLKHNRDSAMESLDPNIDNYRDEMDALVEEMKAVEGVISALNATQDSGEHLFETVEPVVQKRMGDRFVHPLQEFGIKSIEDRGRFVDRSMQYVEDEETQIVKKKKALLELCNAIEQEKGDAPHALEDRPEHPAVGY